MEGCLLLPPDRGTIIGRAVWKSRYVILGPMRQKTPPQPPPLPRSVSSGRLQNARMGLGSSSSRLAGEDSSSNELWLSVYKQNANGELLAQVQVSSIRSCEIQSIQYRKPGPVMPTLIITFEPDPAVDRSRKRRSSRTGGLSSSNSWPNSLLFRSIPEERFNIYDWQIIIQPQIKSMELDGPISDSAAPTFDSFINPFASRLNEGERQTSARPSSRPGLYQRASSNTFTSTQSIAPREQLTSTLISPSPSLRSRRSDLSSQASYMSRPNGYNTTLPIQQLPSDLPSPASTMGYDDQLISGWTSAQGRSSALSSHTRGSNSISMAGTPPAPRETILDRAFQMRYIPGSERVRTAEDESNMSSLARFEALMKEVDERRNPKAATGKETRKDSANGWELEEEDEDSDAESVEEVPNRSFKQKYEDSDVEDEEEEVLAASIHENLPTPAQRALEYISGRSTPGHSQRPMSPQQPPPLPLLSERPHLHNKGKKPRPQSLALPRTSASNSHSNSPERESASSPARNPNRGSSTSAKRLSFTEFAKRLSSTSSLLLVQTNTSTSTSSKNSRHSAVSSDASFGFENEEGGGAMHRGLSQSRLSGMMAASGQSRTSASTERDRDSKCGWRGSGLGVFGGEGGFL